MTWVLERSLSPATLLDPRTDDRGAIVKYLCVDRPAVMARMLREHVLPPPDALREYHPGLRSVPLAVAYLGRGVSLGAAALRKTRLWLGA